MNKNILKYFLNNMRNSVIIYYLVILFLNSFFALSFQGGGSSGMAGITFIFLFVVGLNSFKETFFHFLAMCQTRRSMFLGFVLSSGVVALVMAIADTLMALLFNSFSDEIFISLAISDGKTGTSLPLFVSMICLYFMALMVGYAITVAYYRMDKSMKWIVSVSVPAVLFVLLPYLDSMYFNGAITEAFVQFVSNTFLSINGYISALSALVGSAVVAGLAFMGVRTAAIK